MPGLIVPKLIFYIFRIMLLKETSSLKDKFINITVSCDIAIITT